MLIYVKIFQKILIYVNFMIILCKYRTSQNKKRKNSFIFDNKYLFAT